MQRRMNGVHAGNLLRTVQLNIYSTSTSSIGTVNSSTSNVNVNGGDNTVDISSDAVNEADVTSTTNQNNQACPNLSTQPGASLC